MKIEIAKQTVQDEQPLDPRQDEILQSLEDFLAEHNLTTEYVSAQDIFVETDYINSFMSFGEYVEGLRSTPGIEVSPGYVHGCLAVLVRLIFVDVFLEENSEGDMPQNFSDRVEIAITALAGIGEPSECELHPDPAKMSPSTRHTEIRKALMTIANLEGWSLELHNLAESERTDRTDILSFLVEERCQQAAQIIVSLQSKN